MSLAFVQSRALVGLHAAAVTVEVHLANGLPSFTLVGLADVEVKEARERVRSAVINAGLEFPHNKRITVNLAPADLPKDSGRFDLPIALGILAASGQIEGERLAGFEFAGELSLSGELRPIRGALAMSMALCQQAVPTALVLPMESAKEAALAPTAIVMGAKTLTGVVQRFERHAAEPVMSCPSVSANAPCDAPWVRVTAPPSLARTRYADMADVKGQVVAKRALEIAAAGGHSLLLMGPPGAGKSMLATRFAGLLPDMTLQEALESAAVSSVGGSFQIAHWGQRPTRSPHHTASAVALVGGGSPPRPGDISMAHHGVLFLDELPEFPRSALEALREPLESGTISISRAARRSEFPARFQLIAAMNPCPCGYLGSKIKACRCTPDQVLRYQNKISGPLLDRIDMHVEVAPLSAQTLLAPKGDTPSRPPSDTGMAALPTESTDTLRARCTQAFERAMRRQGKSNSALQGQEIDHHVNLDDTALRFLTQAATKLGWSARATHRSLKVARTIADLAESELILAAHVAESIQYRRGLMQG